MSSFTRLAEIFNRKLSYEELVHEGGFSLPKRNRRELNSDIAEWTLKNINNFNSGNPRVHEMINTCVDYLELIALETTLQDQI